MWNGEPMGYRTRGKMAVGASREIRGCVVSRSHTMEEFFDVKAGFGNWGCVVCKSSHVGRTPSCLDSDNSNSNSTIIDAFIGMMQGCKNRLGYFRFR